MAPVPPVHGHRGVGEDEPSALAVLLRELKGQLGGQVLVAQGAQAIWWTQASRLAEGLVRQLVALRVDEVPYLAQQGHPSLLIDGQQIVEGRDPRQQRTARLPPERAGHLSQLSLDARHILASFERDHEATGDAPPEPIVELLLPLS